MRSHFRFVLVVLFLLLFSSAAYAQSITFTVAGTLTANGFTFTFGSGSTISIDISTGLVTASNITIPYNGDTFTLSNLTIGGPNEIFWANSNLIGALTITPPSSFIGFTGGPVKAVYIPDISTAYVSSDTTLTPTTCHLGLPASLYIRHAGPLSKTSEPTVMTAGFSSAGPNVASACGYAQFDWQQQITNWPLPSSLSRCTPYFDFKTNKTIYPCLSVPGTNTYLKAPPAFYDPPNDNGYTYMDSPAWSRFLNAVPFYYSLQAASTFPIFDGFTLLFMDQPANDVISLPPAARQPGPNYMAFTTSLVGVRKDGTYDILRTWTWQSTYTGKAGGVNLTTTVTATIAPDDGSGTGGVTITSIDGVPVTEFSAFSNKLEATSTGFELVSDFTLGSGSGGINPLTEAITLEVGSYVVTISAGSFHKTSTGNYVYEGTIGSEHLELRIVPGLANTYTLHAEASGTTAITLGTPPLVELTIGYDMGAGTAKLDD